MAQRFEITESVSKTAGVGSANLQVASGVSVTVKDLSGNNLTVYQGETGSSTHTNPLTTDANGRIEGWVEAPDFDLDIAAPSAYTQKIRMSPPGIYNPKSYGVRLDNTTDDTTAWRACVTAAAGDPIVFPEGRTLVSGPITGASASSTALHLAGEGAAKSVFVQTGDHRIIWLTRTSGATLTLSANASAGDTTLTFTSTSGVTAGDWLELRSTVTVPGPKGSVEGEMVQVKSLTGTVLTLYGPIEGSYTTANTAVVRIQPKIEGVVLRDFSIENEDANNTGKTTSEAVALTHTLGARVSNLRFERMEQQALVMEDSIDWVVDGCEFFDSSNDVGDLGYGVVANAACRGGIVSRCFMRGGRHLFTTGSTSGRSVPKHILVTDCRAEDMDGAAFDTHQEGQFITFANCVASRMFGSSNPAFNIRSPDCTVVNPVVVGAPFCIYVSDATAAVRCTIRGGYLQGLYTTSGTTGIDGIRCLADDMSVDGVRIRRTGEYGIRVVTGSRARIRNVEIDDTGNAGAGDNGVYLQAGSDHVVDGLLVENSDRALRIDTGVTARIERVRERSVTNDWNASTTATYNTQRRIRTIASAATITLFGGENDVFTISGTADITSITATGQTGRIVVLRFSGTAATNGVVDGSNLKLAGNLAYTPNDTLTLFCDGTDWFEMARAVN